MLSVARVSARHPVWAVVGWFVLVAGCVLLGQTVGMVSATPIDLGNGDSRRAAEMAHEAGLTKPATEYVLIGPGSPAGDPAQVQSVAVEVAEALAADDQVEHVGQVVPNGDGWLLLPLTLKGDPQTAYERIGPVRDITAQIAEGHPDIVVEQTGQASIREGNLEQVDKNFFTAETLSIPLTLVVLIMVFGAFVAAVIPVVLALTAVAGAMGMSAVVSHMVPDSGMTSNVILMIGMAVGVDYSLFYLKREREERHNGADVRTAIEKAAETSGHAVVFAGGSVVVSLAGLYLADDTMFISMAWSAILVVVIAVLGSLTVLPALLVLLSKYLDRPRVPLVWRLTNQAEVRPPRLWPALLRPSLARPAATMVATVVVLLAAAAPMLSMRLDAQQISELPSVIPAIATLHTMNEQFPQVGSSFDVVVRADPSQTDTVRTRLDELATEQSADLGEPPVVLTSADGSTSTVTIVSTVDPTSSAAEDFLVTLRDTLLPEALRDLPGAEGAVGGTMAYDYDFSQNMRSRLGLVVGFVLLFNLLVMAATFRSLVVGAITLVMNLLSTGVAFGVLAVVFQHHWFDSLIGFTTTGKVISWVPLFLFVILVGLSMDYHVFVLHRVYEAARSGVTHREAVRDGIVRSAGVITSAAIVMVVMFTMFSVVSSFQDFTQLTLGLTVAVLVDVVVIRGFLMPATLLVLGRWTWWPSSLYRAAGPVVEPAVGTRLVVEPAARIRPVVKPVVGTRLVVKPIVGTRLVVKPAVGTRLVVKPAVRTRLVVEPAIRTQPVVEPASGTLPVVRTWPVARTWPVIESRSPVRPVGTTSVSRSQYRARRIAPPTADPDLRSATLPVPVVQAYRAGPSPDRRRPLVGRDDTPIRGVPVVADQDRTPVRGLPQVMIDD